jgi:hypothetical protein
MMQALTMALTMYKIKTRTRMNSYPLMTIEIQKNTMKTMKGEREKAAISLLEIKSSINWKKDQMKEIQMIMMIKVTNTIIMATVIEKETVLTKIVLGLIEGITILKLSLKYL